MPLLEGHRESQVKIPVCHVGTAAHPRPPCKRAGIVCQCPRRKGALRDCGTSTVMGGEPGTKNERTQVRMIVVRDLG